MKNKLLVAISLFLFVGIISVSAAWNSYSPASDAGKCYNQDCATWHNNGYYGYSDGTPSYQNGTSFATFNGFTDQETEDGRQFREMQFAYLETQLFTANNDPPMNPWDNRPAYLFNTPQATSYTIDFNTNPNQTKKIGVWAYLHNNGVGGDYPNGKPALGTTLSLTDAGSLFGTNAKTEYKPTYKIKATNTYPKLVMADVTIKGNKAFILNPTQGFLVREQPNGGGTNIVDLTNPNNDLDKLLSNGGLSIRNRTGVGTGILESCDQHYMMAYVEFEAVPVEQPKTCRSLQIIKPSAVNNGIGSVLNPPILEVPATGLNNVPMQIQVDTDAGAVNGYEYFSSGGNVKFDGQSSVGSTGVRLNKTSVTLTGTPKNNELIWVWAMQADNPDEYYGECADAFKVKLQNQGTPECADFKTNPGKAGSSVVEINIQTPTAVPVTINTLKDTNGDPYKLANGNFATIRYCYSNNSVTYSPAQYKTTDRCAEAPSNIPPISFTPTRIGMLTIEVVGSEGACNDSVKTVEKPTTNVTCKDLTTNPGGGDTINLEAGTPITVNVTSLTDTDGGAYFDPSPYYEYCYTGSIYLNHSLNNYIPNKSIINNECIRTAQNHMDALLPYTAGTMTIKVVGQNQCNDSFTVGQTTTNEDCLSLRIVPQTFDDNGQYSVVLDLEPDQSSYEIHWDVTGSNGQSKLSTTIANRSSIILSDYNNYTFVPGDTLSAQAIIKKFPDLQCQASLTSNPKRCERFTLNSENFLRGVNNRICFRTDWPYFNEVQYRSSNGRSGSLPLIAANDNCFMLTKSITENADRIDIWLDGQEQCNDYLTYQEKPPLFDKFVKAEGDSQYRTSKTYANFNDTSLEYKIEYTHYNAGVQDVTITDTIGRGPIQGDVQDGDGLGGTITYDDNMTITAGGKAINKCSKTGVDKRNDLCWEGDIGNRDGVDVYNLPDNEKVVITYKAKLDSNITPGECSKPGSIFNETGICGETYQNTARFKDNSAEGTDNTELWIPCPFIIIRAGGDVVFENPLDYGVDTMACYDIANADVPIIIPEEEQPGRTPATGGESVTPSYTGDICKKKDAPGYKDLTGSFSSLICEVSFKTTQDLTQKAIVQSINTNKEKISRFEKNLNNWSPVISGDEPTMLPESRNKVYYKNTGDLTFEGFPNVTFSSGARTFIVEDHNVIINSNITYKDSDPNNPSSIAIIVINGSIIIDKDVTETSGVFFVQEGENSNSGKVCAGPYIPGNFCQDQKDYSEVQLIHYGSIYGDIEHLFKYRIYAGDPTKEEGALVIRFDNRVYVNTPPVLNQLVQISQEITS